MLVWGFVREWEFDSGNLVPRGFLRHTLITKPNEYPGTFRSNLPRKWEDMQPLLDLQFARQRQATKNARCPDAISAIDKSRY